MRFVVVSALLVVAGCKSEDKTPPPPPPEKAPEPPPPRKKLGPVSFGTCTLKATGAFEAEETIEADKKSAASRYWQAEDERGAVPMPALSINCVGKDLRISIVSSPNGAVPYGLKTYDVVKNGDLVLIGRAGDQLSDFAGTVVIDAFDSKHVIGTLKITAKQGMGKKRVAIEGSFDLACPGMAGCAH